MNNQKLRWGLIVIIIILTATLFLGKETLKTLSPEQNGLKPADLLKADQVIKASYPNVYSLLVVKNEELIFERYYQGMGEEDSNNVMSVTKSLISALIGIAINDGKIQNLNQTIRDFYPNYFEDSQVDPLASKIQLQHLLSMTDGFNIKDINNAMNVSNSDNMIKQHIQIPLYAQPGTTFYYSNQTPQITSGIITKATGLNALDYADLKIFNPLGMHSDKQWATDKQGNSIGGIGLHLTPREMMKFGLLYLNHGSYAGQQIIPADYVKLSTQKQATGNFFGFGSYGYGWWMLDNDNRYADQAIYYAAGFGGQYIFVVPNYQVVVVITAELPTNGAYNDPIKIFTDFIMPNVMNHE